MCACDDESNESDVAAKAASLLSRGAAADCSPGASEAVAQLCKIACERPPAAFGGRPPDKGDIKARRIKDANLPLVRGRAAEGGRGSLTSHTSRWATAPSTPGLHSAAAPRF